MRPISAREEAAGPIPTAHAPQHPAARCINARRATAEPDMLQPLRVDREPYVEAWRLRVKMAITTEATG